MKLQIQSGIDATKFQLLMREMALTGYQCQAHAEREIYKAKLKLMGKRAELPPAQGDLFGEEV